MRVELGVSVVEGKERSPVRSSRAAQPREVWRRGGSLLLVVGFLAAGSPREAPAQWSASEYELKAAFVYNFAKFIEWPPEAFDSSQAPLVLGIFGPDPFGPVLDPLTQKTIQGRRLQVRRVERIQELSSFHVLYVSAAETERLPQILSRLGSSSVLTVGETERFTRLGGIIAFTLAENKIRFAINPQAAARARLRISSQLLKLAILIREEPRG